MGAGGAALELSPQKQHDQGYESLGCVRPLAASLIEWELNYDSKNHNNNNSKYYALQGFKWANFTHFEIDTLSKELHWGRLWYVLDKNLTESISSYRHLGVCPNNSFLSEFLKMDLDLTNLKRSIPVNMGAAMSGLSDDSCEGFQGVNSISSGDYKALASYCNLEDAT